MVCTAGRRCPSGGNATAMRRIGVGRERAGVQAVRGGPDRQRWEDGDAEVRGDERLDRDVVVGGEADVRFDPDPAADPADDLEPGARRGAPDPGLVGEIAQGERATADERVARRQDDRERVVEQRDRGEARRMGVGCGGVVVDQREIQLAAVQAGEEALHVVADDRQGDVGPHAAVLIGAFQLAAASVQSTDRLAAAFRSGAGIGWGEHHHELFPGCERFFAPSYRNHLVTWWIPGPRSAATR
jgi:hypothetical protein